MGRIRGCGRGVSDSGERASARIAQHTTHSTQHTAQYSTAHTILSVHLSGSSCCTSYTRRLVGTVGKIGQTDEEDVPDAMVGGRASSFKTPET